MRLAVVSIVLCLSCASTAVVKRTKHGGVIALRGPTGMAVRGETNHARAMDDARKQMAEHCGDAGFEIVSEEEVPTGVSQQGGDAYSQSTVTTEWRVTYECVK